MNRKTINIFHVFYLALALNLMACNQNPPESLKTIEFLGLSSSLPDSWVEEQPSSDMRLAQFQVPGTDANNGANLVLYFFGQGQGGTADANIARWQSQFSNPGGGIVEPLVEKMLVNEMPVTIVELRGDYARGVGMGPAASATPDQILLASIVESPRGNVYIQLHGPSGTVSTQREAYMRLVRNIRSKG